MGRGSRRSKRAFTNSQQAAARAAPTQDGKKQAPAASPVAAGPAVGAAGSLIQSQRFLIPLICVLLALAVAAVFGQTVRHDFVNYDDEEYVYENPHVQHGVTVDDVVWAFTKSHSHNWHPLTWISHMLDCQFYGPWPGGHHLTNVILHAATAILLFLVLRWMTGRLWLSALVAAVFAVHPLRVESVAWASERKDVLSGLFFVLTIGAYVWYVRRPSAIGRYIIVMALFALGLMAKPMLVTLPFVLLLLDYWPLGRFEGEAVCGKYIRLIAEKIPLLALVAGSCVATLLAQRTAMIALDNIPLPERIANALVAYAAYLWQLLCPVNLTVLYLIPRGGFSPWLAAAALLVLTAISVGVLVWRRQCPYLLVGWLWYLGMLMPVIGLVQVGEQAMADRYTYLPHIGLCILIAWAVADIASRRGYSPRSCGIAAVALLAVLMAGAWQQTKYWRDSESLWNRALSCNSQNATVHYNLANVLYRGGRLDEAVRHYKESLSIASDRPKSYASLANALSERGQFNEAIGDYEKALELGLDDVKTHINLANALVRLGRLDEAVAHYKRTIEIDPGCASAYGKLGDALSHMGRFREAVASYRKSLDIEPDNAKINNNFASTLTQVGRINEAIVHCQKAIELKPDFADPYNNLGNALVRLGRLDEAEALYRKALEIRPDYADAHHNLGAALAYRGKKADADVHLRQWARLTGHTQTDRP